MSVPASAPAADVYAQAPMAPAGPQPTGLFDLTAERVFVLPLGEKEWLTTEEKELGALKARFGNIAIADQLSAGSYIENSENHNDVWFLVFDKDSKQGLLITTTEVDDPTTLDVWAISGDTCAWRRVLDLDLFVQYVKGQLILQALK